MLIIMCNVKYLCGDSNDESTIEVKSIEDMDNSSIYPSTMIEYDMNTGEVVDNSEYTYLSILKYKYMVTLIDYLTERNTTKRKKLFKKCVGIKNRMKKVKEDK